MRSLKFWTTALLVFGLLLLMGSPILLMRRPVPGAPRDVRAVFAITMTTYVVVLLLVFFAVTYLSWRLIVKQREEYQAKHLENLKELVEGTLQDHQKKAEP